MILADEITCQIADPNAAKVELINCSTSLIGSAKGLELMWIAIGAIGAFGAMLITIFMARYAWKAWVTSREQLEHMRRESSLLRRQPALVDFLRILRSYYHEAADSPGGLVSPSKEEVNFAADIWLLSYPILVGKDPIWKILVSFELILKKKKNFEDLIRGDLQGLGEELVENLELCLIKANLQAEYTFNQLTKVCMELHREERSENDALMSFEILEDSIDRSMRRIDEVLGM